ncbi:methyl-accepting chemotaxis protein [Rhizobium sp. L1K21]|uniref:methyl-accepting chemotaxis protein n=1 Tax=Rhizobium sp. L1K21 TaxID=2954933 RepID=UPI0020929BA2|nr:methyl-accepting chemotaxis protein [Rhizobium sp. L1K21]MCO6186877.1 methyl-accepting chemotaxis protein [Rhizobium sp. L1K21]
MTGPTMLSKIRNLPMTLQILFGVFLVLAAGETYKVSTTIAQDWKQIAVDGELRGDAALDMLEALHVQAMLNRGQLEEGDPAVETLNGTMQLFSQQNENTDIWVVMAPKVINFQKENDQPVLLPKDSFDEQAIQNAAHIAQVEGNHLRLTRPVVLGVGTAADERCEGCHTGMMEIEKGEVMGAYSAAVDLGPEIAAWKARLWTRILTGVVMLVLTLGFIMLMLRLTALKPLRHLAAVTGKLAEGNVDVATGMEGRRDEIGSLARALEIFRKAVISNKRLEAETEEHRKQAEANRIAAQQRAEAEAAEKLRVATAGLASGMKRLASGDLSFQIEEKFAPEFEELRQDFNASIEQLGSALQSISRTAVAIDRDSSEIATGVDELSKRTEDQASSLEQTTVALGQITANVQSSATRVIDTQSIAAEANDSAVKSRSVVSNAETSMERIQESSGKIASIIGLIDEIAFQTNLLALNAGVEAARAGDAGKGFAVVAQEVRALAGRSAEAAKEIRELIDNSTHEIEGGVRHVREAGDALTKIAELIASIHEHMDAITASSKEQSTGIGEVNRAAATLDHVTQQNVTMVEKASASSASLAEEAALLREMVARFKLAESVSASARDRAA